MITNRLFDAAMALREAAPWKAFAWTTSIAVRHADGAVSLCNMDFPFKEEPAFYADNGIKPFLRTSAFPEEDLVRDSLSNDETDYLQDHDSLCFVDRDRLSPEARAEVLRHCERRGIRLPRRDAWPQIEAHRPYHDPRALNEAEQERLAESIEAVLELHAHREELKAAGFDPGEVRKDDYFDPFGKPYLSVAREGDGLVWQIDRFPPRAAWIHPSPLPEDAALLDALRAKDKRGAWACRIFLSEMDIGEGEEIWYPYQLLIVNNTTGEVIASPLSPVCGEYAQPFLQAVCELIQERGRPVRVLAQDRRTCAFFERLAAALEFKLVLQAENQKLDDAVEALDEPFAEE